LIVTGFYGEKERKIVRSFVEQIGTLLEETSFKIVEADLGCNSDDI
jgi:hypothetical protein